MSAGSETEAEDATDEEDAIHEHDLEALRTTQSEARAVLDHQIRTFNDVDNKAARTFRLDAVLLGLILTGVSFLVRSQSFDIGPYVNAFSLGGVVALVLSFVVAVVTYTSTSIQTGLGPVDVQRLVDERYNETEWLVLLLRSEAEWMRRNERQQNINGVLLTISHAALIAAVLGLSVGITVVHWSF